MARRGDHGVVVSLCGECWSRRESHSLGTSGSSGAPFLPHWLPGPGRSDWGRRRPDNTAGQTCVRILPQPLLPPRGLSQVEATLLASVSSSVKIEVKPHWQLCSCYYCYDPIIWAELLV